MACMWDMSVRNSERKASGENVLTRTPTCGDDDNLFLIAFDRTNMIKSYKNKWFNQLCMHKNTFVFCTWIIVQAICLTEIARTVHYYYYSCCAHWGPCTVALVAKVLFARADALSCDSIAATWRLDHDLAPPSFLCAQYTYFIMLNHIINLSSLELVYALEDISSNIV